MKNDMGINKLMHVQSDHNTQSYHNIIQSHLEKKMSAYTLIEMSITLTILGIISLTLFATINTMQKSYKIQTTKHREQIILKALGKHVSTHNCLPYPCKPSEQHIGLSPAIPDISPDFSLTTIECIGVIPWQTLGIPRETIYDGYGNPFTYIMHPVLGKIPEKTSFQPSIPTFVQNAYGNLKNIRILPNDFYYRLDSQLDKHALYYKQPIHAGEVNKYYQAAHEHTEQILSIDRFQATVPEKNIEEEREEIHQKIQDNEMYMINHSDIIHKHQYDNFITLHYNANQDGNMTSHTIHDTPGENTFKLPLTMYNYCITADCVAVVLISHGTTGGHFDKTGNKTPTKNIHEARQNATTEHLSPLNGGRYHIHLNSADSNFDQHVTYVTRFNFHLYGGPVLNNHYLLKVSTLAFDLMYDAYYFEHFTPPFGPLYKFTKEEDRPMLPGKESPYPYNTFKYRDEK